MAGFGDKWFVVVDGKEGKQYDWVRVDTLIFSPDSTRLIYEAKKSNKVFVVLDEKEGRQYDSILCGWPMGGWIIFDSHDNFHYLARKNDGVYLVEERI